MVLKELDPFHGGTQEEIAARIAQDRMAYHLRRYFGRSSEVDVMNQLRVRSGEDMALVEHLLLHPHGLIVVERARLTGRVVVLEDGQWMRELGAPNGQGAQLHEMRSPITRAYLRALSLKALLDRNVRQKGFFDRLELDILVAVSESAQIQWPRQGMLGEVCRTDDVHARVAQRVLQCRQGASVAGPLSGAERRRLADFLRTLHRPLARGAAPG
jgi:hypothetical protein